MKRKQEQEQQPKPDAGNSSNNNNNLAAPAAKRQKTTTTVETAPQLKQQQYYFSLLNDDIISLVLSYCTLKDLGTSVALVCRHWWYQILLNNEKEEEDLMSSSSGDNLGSGVPRVPLFYSCYKFYKLCTELWFPTSVEMRGRVPISLQSDIMGTTHALFNIFAPRKYSPMLYTQQQQQMKQQKQQLKQKASRGCKFVSLADRFTKSKELSEQYASTVCVTGIESVNHMRTVSVLCTFNNLLKQQENNNNNSNNNNDSCFLDNTMLLKFSYDSSRSICSTMQVQAFFCSPLVKEKFLFQNEAKKVQEAAAASNNTRANTRTKYNNLRNSSKRVSSTMSVQPMVFDFNIEVLDLSLSYSIDGIDSDDDDEEDEEEKIDKENKEEESTISNNNMFNNYHTQKVLDKKVTRVIEYDDSNKELHRYWNSDFFKVLLVDLLEFTSLPSTSSDDQLLDSVIEFFNLILTKIDIGSYTSQVLETQEKQAEDQESTNKLAKIKKAKVPIHVQSLYLIKQVFKNYSTTSRQNNSNKNANEEDNTPIARYCPLKLTSMVVNTGLNRIVKLFLNFNNNNNANMSRLSKTLTQFLKQKILLQCSYSNVNRNYALPVQQFSINVDWFDYLHEISEEQAFVLEHDGDIGDEMQQDEDEAEVTTLEQEIQDCKALAAIPIDEHVKQLVNKYNENKNKQQQQKQQEQQRQEEDFKLATTSTTALPVVVDERHAQLCHQCFSKITGSLIIVWDAQATLECSMVIESQVHKGKKLLFTFEADIEQEDSSGRGECTVTTFYAKGQKEEEEQEEYDHTNSYTLIEPSKYDLEWNLDEIYRLMRDELAIKEPGEEQGWTAQEFVKCLCSFFATRLPTFTYTKGGHISYEPLTSVELYQQVRFNCEEDLVKKRRRIDKDEETSDEEDAE